MMMVLKLEVKTGGGILSFPSSPNVTGTRVANEPATNRARKAERSRREIGSELRKRPNGINEEEQGTASPLSPIDLPLHVYLEGLGRASVPSCTTGSRDETPVLKTGRKPVFRSIR